MNTDPILNHEKQVKWFNKIQKSDDEIYWVINYERIPVGLIYIQDINRDYLRCYWGYYIAELQYRSLQLALFLEWNLYDYVFDHLKLHKLCNETFVENKQVVKLHELCGSVQDGLLRDHIYKNGEFYDVSTGSILASEWEKKKKEIEFEHVCFEEG